MANTFLDLPMPAENGPGASVDTSAMGKTKTVIIGGEFLGATVTVEVSVDGGIVFQPLSLFSGAGKRVFNCACSHMRVQVKGRGAATFTANCDVGANDNGALFEDLDIPVGDGYGNPIDISALGGFKTFVVGGEFSGASITVELSEDGISYVPCKTFQSPGGLYSKELIANFARVLVAGRAGNTFPFTPTVAMGAANDPSSGSVGATGQQFVNTLSFGGGRTHASDTPLVVNQKDFDPTDYALANATRSLEFRAVAANAGLAPSTNVQLYNLTDDEPIATLNFTSSDPTAESVALVEGPGPGEVDLASRVYEVRIWVDNPDGQDDAIEFGSADLVITNTID